MDVNERRMRQDEYNAGKALGGYKRKTIINFPVPVILALAISIPFFLFFFLVNNDFLFN